VPISRKVFVHLKNGQTTGYYKASIRRQDSLLSISGYWPTSEPNVG